MEKVAFGKTGFDVSRLGFGAAPIGLLSVEQESAGRVVNLLLDGGVNFIDTAAGYAGSEEMLGNTISHRRGDFVVVSKCGQSFNDLPGAAWSAEVVEATIDRSLKRLKTDHLDVMLLHSCEQEILEKGEALEALVKARTAGKIRFAGYSGDNETVAYAAKLADVAVIETSINLVDQANIEKVLPIADEKGLGVIVKRPVANAAWKPLEEQPGMYRSYAEEYHRRFKAMGLRREDFGVEDWTELALRFTLSIAGAHTAIIGTTSLKNAARNLEITAKGPLPKEAVKQIRAAYQSAGGQEWLALQ